MVWSATFRSVSWRHASGEIGSVVSCIGAKTTRIAIDRRCFLNNSFNIIDRVVFSKMLTTFEDRVFRPKCHQTRHTIKLANSSTSNGINNCNGNSYTNGMQQQSKEDIQLEYEKAIETLNTLQSNADTIRRSIANNVKQTAVRDMPNFLERSGITFEELDKQSFIHVSGTKGKGSTCALTESILRSYGAKTGFFSSPHLVSVTERIRLNGEPIGKQQFTKAFWRVYRRLVQTQDASNKMPAYFHFLMLLALHIFMEAKVDVIILEVGIGGELDCTNIIRNTKTVGITSLGLEHTQILGNTLSEIAWQKAGIIKSGSHVYTSVTQPECLDVIKQRAAEKKATLHTVPDFSEYYKDSLYKTELSNLNNVVKLNGSLAIQLAYDWLRQHKNGLKQNIAINETKLTKAIVDGMVNCNWPGRCQRVQFKNLNIHLDGAHTVESMHVCSDWFAKVTANSKAPRVLIFNTTGDRDSKRLLEVLRQYSNFDCICFTPNIVSTNDTNRNDILSSSGYAEQLKRAKTHAGNWYLLCTESNECDNSQVFESISDSFNYLREHYGTERELDVLVTGSLHLLGATILALK